MLLATIIFLVLCIPTVHFLSAMNSQEKEDQELLKNGQPILGEVVDVITGDEGADHVRYTYSPPGLGREITVQRDIPTTWVGDNPRKGDIVMVRYLASAPGYSTIERHPS